MKGKNIYINYKEQWQQKGNENIRRKRHSLVQTNGSVYHTRIDRKASQALRIYTKWNKTRKCIKYLLKNLPCTM